MRPHMRDLAVHLLYTCSSLFLLLVETAVFSTATYCVRDLFIPTGESANNVCLICEHILFRVICWICIIGNIINAINDDMVNKEVCL